MKRFFAILCLFLSLVIVSAVPVSAAKAYATYVYDATGWAADSPDAYVPEAIVDAKTIGHGVSLEDVSDIYVDSDLNVYLAVPKTSMIIVLNPDYSFKFTIKSFVNTWGIPDSLDQSKGVFVDKKNIYVADTEKNRIVVFDKEGKFERIILQPESDVFPEGSVYKPIAVAVDSAGRLYVVSSTTNQGIVSMNSGGEFMGFLGAQKVTPNMFEIFWRNFQTAAQRAASLKNVATEYNNINIDDAGFVYATISSIPPASQQAAIVSKNAAYAPVKRLNPAGADVLQRTDVFAPGGEIAVRNGGEISGASKIIDVAIGPDGMWSIIDEKRQKTYTYSEEGKLLYIFGDSGMQFGALQRIAGIAYQGTKLLLLDKTSKNFVVYKRTEYGDIIAKALRNHRERKYGEAVNDWREILKRNNNFDLAYIGIGKSYYRAGEYEKAMEQAMYTTSTSDYSDAFKQFRKNWIVENVIWIPIILAVIIAGVMLFMKNATKVNKRDQIREGRKLGFASHALYGFYIIFHPFDGFWDMKHEKRGSMGAATFYLLLACISFVFKDYADAYIINPWGNYSNFVATFFSILTPVALWCVANWCLTTLFDGEGSMKDIYMATCYATIPIMIVTFATTIASNVMINEEIPILNMIQSITWVWVGMLVFFGAMIVHDYSIGKNVLTAVGTIVGMAFIMFVAVLFSSLLLKMVSFVASIYLEISYRM